MVLVGCLFVISGWFLMTWCAILLNLGFCLCVVVSLGVEVLISVLLGFLLIVDL